MGDFDSRAFKRFCEDVLSKLATFQTACEAASRSDAGRVLGIGGQAVGKAIKGLEASLKGPLNNEPLIDHSGPLTVVPTEAGEMLLSFAQQIRTLSIQFYTQPNTAQHSGNVRLAMTRSAWLAYGNALRTAYSNIRPDGAVTFGNAFYSRDRVWDDIERTVLRGDADFGVYSFPPSRTLGRGKKSCLPDGLAIHALTEEEIVRCSPAIAPTGQKGKRYLYGRCPPCSR